MELYKGDCLEVMKTIEDNSIDAIITDPPYGTTACKWDSVIDFDLMWEQLNRIIKPNGAIVLFGSEPFSSALRMSNIKNYKNDWIFEKSIPTGGMAKYQPMKKHEYIMVFYKNKCTFNPIMENRINSHSKGNKKTYTKVSEHLSGTFNLYPSTKKRRPTSVLNIKSVPRPNSIHPTQKPVALMEYLIKTYTNENETVLDFTMGSGSTGVACQNTNRNFIGIEMDDKYFDIASKRIGL
jgi:site-specific DNA-methyltransferase (adenine-specific)